VSIDPPFAGRAPPTRLFLRRGRANGSTKFANRHEIETIRAASGECSSGDEIVSPAVSMTEPQVNEPPRGHVRVVYLGPVAPHWEVHSDFGDRATIEEFRARVLARLELLPPHDPQFRRNRERVARDAERENLLLQWDLGIPEEEDQTSA
jgi:hypothetical protein